MPAMTSSSERVLVGIIFSTGWFNVCLLHCKMIGSPQDRQCLAFQAKGRRKQLRTKQLGSRALRNGSLMEQCHRGKRLLHRMQIMDGRHDGDSFLIELQQ